MRYKTTVEIFNDAETEHEAADMAGEFLQGDFRTGADIKVKTVSSAKSTGVKAVLTICLTAAILSLFVLENRISYRLAKSETKPVTSYAIQPPLKTGLLNLNDLKQFKENWDKKQKERVDSIAR
ncbi:MAG: hypothetical protein PHO42_01405 [Candidatus Omnitrophica bacterium]|nr:hypothetical protein [Candidatus Omnitrophota bacterium]